MAADASSGAAAPGAAGPAGGLPRWARIAIIGATAGLFASLFGVGGGIVMVPLLIGLLAYDAKVATATSLAAIIFTSVVGTATFGLLDNVEWDDALLIGVPAVGGLLIGLVLKARISSRALTLAFAVFLVAVAVRLVLE